MNATDTQTYLQATSIRQHTNVAPSLAGVVRRLRDAALTLTSALERRAAVADEQQRRRALQHYRRNTAALEHGSFRFDPRTDDLFAREDA
jgi:hypothetical protein